jgi:hypothetical protein
VSRLVEKSSLRKLAEVGTLSTSIHEVHDLNLGLDGDY